MQRRFTTGRRDFLRKALHLGDERQCQGMQIDRRPHAFPSPRFNPTAKWSVFDS